MKTLAVLILLATPLLAQLDKATADYVEHDLYSSTVLLYSQNEQGDMQMRCTATAIDHSVKGYIFVTAAHCACQDDVEKRAVSPERTAFYISPDDVGTKEFLKAEPVGCGYRHRGDDFALFQVVTEKKFPVIPLGIDPKMMEQVVNVASPLGLGKQVFFGTVSSPLLDRPVVVDDINWQNVFLLQLFGVNGGSSGSSLLCLDQKAICGFVVGSLGDTTMTAMPVSRLQKVRAGIADGSYKYWQPEADMPSVKPSAKTKK